MSNGTYKILAFDVLDSSAARVQLSIVGDAKSQIGQFDNDLRERGLRVVESSARVFNENKILNKKTLNVLVVRNQQTKEATQTNKSRMMAVAANMFVDSDNSIWSEDNGLLVKNDNIETAEHLEKILTASANLASPFDAEGRGARSLLASDTYRKPKIDSGMYAVYEHQGQLYDGFVVAMSEDETQAIMQPRPDDIANPYPEHRISVSHVVESFDLEKLTTEVPTVPPSERLVAEAAGTTLTQALAYYRKVFSYNPEYFRRFSQLLRDRGIYSN